MEWGFAKCGWLSRPLIMIWIVLAAVMIAIIGKLCSSLINGALTITGLLGGLAGIFVVGCVVGGILLLLYEDSWNRINNN